MRNNFFSFWFRYVKKYESYYEQSRTNEVVRFFHETFNSYVGRMFEKFCLELIKQYPKIIPIKFDRIGGQWGKFKGEKGKNTYEIDIVAPNERTREILFAECKWKDKLNAEKILAELKSKANYVKWHNDKRKEYYAIFAKSFKKEIEEKNVYCYDLKDLKKRFKMSEKS